MVSPFRHFYQYSCFVIPPRIASISCLLHARIFARNHFIVAPDFCCVCSFLRRHYLDPNISRNLQNKTSLFERTRYSGYTDFGCTFIDMDAQMSQPRRSPPIASPVDSLEALRSHTRRIVLETVAELAPDASGGAADGLALAERSVALLETMDPLLFASLLLSLAPQRGDRVRTNEFSACSNFVFAKWGATSHKR